MKSNKMPYEIREKLMEINLSARTHLSSTPTGSQLGTGTHAFTLCEEGSVRQRGLWCMGMVRLFFICRGSLIWALPAFQLTGYKLCCFTCTKHVFDEF